MIRKYSNKDRSRILELLRKNIPEYFDASEESDFVHYLDCEVQDYFVYEEDSEIIGAGGINYFPEEKLARISWDMIDPEHQGKEIGKRLTQHRIQYLNNNADVELIVVRTSQLAWRFYEKMGFELEKVEKDFWAKDFDLYQMIMKNKSLL